MGFDDIDSAWQRQEMAKVAIRNRQDARIYLAAVACGYVSVGLLIAGLAVTWLIVVSIALPASWGPYWFGLTFRARRAFDQGDLESRREFNAALRSFYWGALVPRAWTLLRRQPV